mgnify:CR=1 FL=1
METLINNPYFKIIVGLVIFYLGLKTFAGGVKSLGNPEYLQSFVSNPLWAFVGGIVCTILWQSSSLSTTTIVALVSTGVLPMPSAIAAVLGANIGTTGTIWLAGFFVSDGMPTGATRQIAFIHTGVNTLMAVTLLPFVQPIARFRELLNVYSPQQYIWWGWTPGQWIGPLIAPHSIHKSVSFKYDFPMSQRFDCHYIALA